ncbi:hypothetical protein ACF1GW_35630 [Streptomyces achromogenes]|uniref:hypothetical protein n=1 Tax=Streptomyces achromogenes TaxID=67255 RepID=UPI0036F6184B
MQTCRRHPEAGPFARSCPGCARELYDIEARNRAEAEARRALTLHGTPTAEILAVEATPTTLIVATRQPASLAYEYAVDAFRLPTATESDPELGEDYRFTPGAWHLDWQAGEHSADTVPQMMVDARQHLITTGRTADDATVVRSPAPAATRAAAQEIRLTELPTMPVLPATQGAATRAAETATNTFWDHAEDCEDCLNAEGTRVRDAHHCRTGVPLAQRMTTAATIANDFAALDHWYRRGGRERHNATDYIAS